MLFQPTNITPDLRGSLGNGVVDATRNFVVTWQINGTSGMNTFRIKVFNLAGTQIYDTGVITENPIVYGTNAYGERQLFYHDCGVVNALSNGNEYRLQITMTNTALSQTVVQNSMSAFITRAEPSVQITGLGSVVQTKSITINGTYSQAQHDALNWIRWKLAYSGDLDNPIFDSQNIYGTGELQMKYDGLLPDNTYSVKLIVQTENGVIKETPWTSFLVSYSTEESPTVGTARMVTGDTTAVKVSWGGNRYIYGKSVGSYAIGSGVLILPNIGSQVYWDEEAGGDLSIPTPWNIITDITAGNQNSVLLEVNHGQGDTLKLYFDATNQTLELRHGTSSLKSVTPVRNNVRLTVMISPTKLYVVYTQGSGGLYPGETLYPSDTLYPQGDSQSQTYVVQEPISYTQGAINEITLAGIQSNRFLQVINGDVTQIQTYIGSQAYTIEQAVVGGLYTEPDEVVGTKFLADFNNDLNAGSLYIVDDEITGWAVYRQTIGEVTYEHIVDAAASSSSLYDFSVPNNFGEYKYYIYPIGQSGQSSKKYLTNPIVTNNISPNYWNYTILECEYNSDRDCYTVINEFTFGRNLTTKEISNNNNPSINSNFTKYPTVQMDSQNYLSGSLTSLIGSINLEYDSVVYSDNKTLRDKIFNLSTTTNTLFLKTRKGDVILIRIAGPITMATQDNTKTQQLSATIPWVEIGSAKGCHIVRAAYYNG